MFTCYDIYGDSVPYIDVLYILYNHKQFLSLSQAASDEIGTFSLALQTVC